MTRTDPAIEAAARRMLDADAAKDRDHANVVWEAWQRAATDYWVLRHPEQARWRRPAPDWTPAIQETRDRAELVARAMDGIPSDWRLQRASPERTEYLARVGWFHELLVGLYKPTFDALRKLRAGDDSGVETLVRFLEADVYCFRSGYVKADVIRFLTRVELPPSMLVRLRRVVVDVIERYDRREFRSYIRLAKRVDSPAFRQELQAIAASPSHHPARRAGWTLVGLGEPPSSEGEGSDGQSRRG